MTKFSKFHSTWLIGLGVLSIWAAVAPRTRQDWLLENLLVWALLVFLYFTHNQLALSRTSYVLMYSFLALQIYASHWGYMPPIGEWMGEVTGSTRNAFDRFMHLLFGIVFVLPIKEVFEKVFFMRRGTAWLCAIISIVSLGAVYEIIEWIVASIVDPQVGAEFVGLQGDEWDAQKDMALAWGGSIATWIVSWRPR